MFNVVTGRRKGRVWSPRTVAISVGAHVALLAAFVTVAESTPVRSTPADTTITWITPRPPTPPKPITPIPVKPVEQQPAPARSGATLQLHAPVDVPDHLPPVDPDARAVTTDEVRGIGPVGDVIGPQPPDSAAAPADGNGDGPGIIDAPRADVLPQLLNPREAQRILERVYPPQLRDAGIAGRTMVRMIIDADGRVQPGSVTVLETSHDAFRDAAVRAAERFRFRPAEVNGHAVPVYISIPIEWQVQN